MDTFESEGKLPYADFLSNLRKALKSVFYEKADITRFILQRGFPALVLRDIMATNPFSVAIPEQYGGRGANPKECLGLLDTASYESLPLSLLFGINIGLFLGPVSKYANESVKGNIFKRFLEKQNMGGLMITEPDFGSDALNMQTSNVPNDGGFDIKGIKHWQGLTGMADYWIIVSRQKLENGHLARDLDFFICDVQQPRQHIEVLEYYNNIGVYPIPYGKNEIDIHVPAENKMKPKSTGLKLMMDLLHRSRFQFPGMAIGFIRRMLDDAIEHTSKRIIGGKPLIALDQVKYQIARIQSAFTVSSAMCARSARISGIENDLATYGLEANSMKAYVTDLMQEASQTLTQLHGANGFKIESVSSRGIVDSRPFQIFEGSNEMLYTQISDMVLKTMVKKKEMNLADFLSQFNLTSKTAGYFKSLVNFKVDQVLPQRKQVDLGRIISRIVSADYVVSLGDNGFRDDLVRDSLEMLKHEVATLVNSFKFASGVEPVQTYREKSGWMDFC